MKDTNDNVIQDRKIRRTVQPQGSWLLLSVRVDP
jgi:hypothetical protein